MAKHQYQQVISRDSDIVEELCACNIFPPMRIPGFKENFYVNSWNTKPDGTGIKYVGSQTSIHIDYNGLQLYARYNQPTCNINYFYTDGRKTSNKITETYQLINPLKEEPIYNDFKGWLINNQLSEPFSVYVHGWYPVENVSGDVNAYMSSYTTYTLNYDANGGSGNPPQAESQPCNKYVDNTGKIITEAKEVQLPQNTFTPPASKAFFSKWKIDNEEYEVGANVLLSTNLIAYAKWLYNASYYVNAVASPAIAGKVSVEDRSEDNDKCLIVDQITPGYQLYAWIDSSGKNVGNELEQEVTLPTFQPSETQYEYSETFTAQFIVDPGFTQIIYVDGTDQIKEVKGQLTRRMLEEEFAFANSNVSMKRKIILEVKDI